MRKRRLKDSSAGIDFFMLVTQFLRASHKLEQTHDAALKTSTDAENLAAVFSYYKEEKEYLLHQMYTLLWKRAEEISE